MEEKSLSDFKNMLGRLFDSKNFSSQPKYLVEIDCQEGETLAKAYQFIESETERGKKLKEYPFEVIALIHDSDKMQLIRKNLASIPHHIVFISDTKAQTILSALKSIEIKDVESVLYLKVLSKNSQLADFQDYSLLNSYFGLIQFEKYDRVLPGKQLMALAKMGWFPKEGSCYHYPSSHTTLIHYEHRSYIIRQATLEDLKILQELEILCWPKLLAMPKEALQKRIETYPEGQLVLEDANGVEGAVYSQRISEIESVYECQADNVSRLHNPEGPFIQLLALNILPEKQGGELGNELLEFALQKASLAEGVTNVIGVTRCIEYPGSDKISMEAYLKQEVLDPIPRMHVRHGAEVRGVVPNYRPLDKANEGFGVLVFYQLVNRLPNIDIVKKEQPVGVEKEITSESIEAFVDSKIIELLPENEKKRYSRSSPLMDLGLDSLQLMELRSLIGWEFEIELEPTFFFQYGTAQETIDYLISKKVEVYKDWLYEIEWIPLLNDESAPFAHDRLWILFDDGNELSESLCKRLENQNQYCIVVKKGENYQKLNQQTFVINPNTPQEFSRLFEEISTLSQLAGVIYFWGYDGLTTEPTLSTIEDDLRINCGGLIRLANVLATSSLPETSKLWIVQKSIASDGNKTSLVQYPIYALCKVIREEYPKSQCTYLTLDPNGTTLDNCETLFRELQSRSKEPQIAWRNGQRFVARMVSAKLKKFRTPRFSPDASYLIAGGLRSLGLRLARWYYDHGARTIILLDEIGLNPKIEEQINELKALGAEVRTYIADFDNYPMLDQIFKTIRNELPPLKGVIHSAGVIDNDLLIHMEWERFKLIYRLKVAGSWNLHVLTEHLDLDHFILFSTCMTNLAPLGKANSVTSNTFMDALSHYRKKKGLPALTIDWAPWETRFSLIEHLIDNSLSSRMKLMTIGEGLSVFEKLFYFEKPQIMAVQIELSILLKEFIKNDPFFDEIRANLGFQTVEKPILPTKAEIAEPIAIIGMGCRYPGGVDSPEKFWNILKEGVDAITEVPSDRWNIDDYYDPDKNAPGKMYTRYGGFIDHVDLFDPQFFRITPREAEEMDPQQRLGLEVAWEALENAAIPPSTLKGSKTGVFMGICSNDYGQLIIKSGDPAAVDNYYSTGNQYSVLAGRIAYNLGLEGPAMALDTACSSSLVSIDLAVEHLQEGECDLAIAGGVNLILTPETTINFCKSGMLSVDGRCKTFDAAANGYVRSEGCGIVILKRLSDAKRDHNRILAVIRATAINQDGASTGLTVPNGQAQEKLIKSALKKANLEAKNIDYVEAHGTGTSLGDPIEVKAILETYGKSRETPLILGSAKTNIGHSEAAAGVAGLIKCVLSLQNKTIPKHLHFHKINPYIQLGNTIIPEQEIFLKDNKLHLAAVSSFGFSGTNSHAIVEEYQETKTVETISGPYLFLISAKDKKALQDLAKRLAEYIKSHSEIRLSDMAYTLQIGREHFSYRSWIEASDLKDLIARLEILDKVEHAKSNDKILIIAQDNQKQAMDHWLQGGLISWDEYYRKIRPNIVSLPTYPFQRERYWAPYIIQQIAKPVAEKMKEENKPNSPPKKNLDTLVNVFSKALKMPLEKIDPDKNFEEYGLDSILITKLNVDLQLIFGELPATLFYKYKNLNEIANYLEKEHKAPETQPEESKREEKIEGIAIIGMSGTYPQAKDVIDFWENLKAGKDSVTEIPTSRNFDKTKFPEAVWGSFIDDVDKFDMDFFKIAPIEAKYASPNERLFLQEAWKCIESAGYRPDNLVSGDARVGVFAGASYNDYGLYANEIPPSEKRTPVNTQTYSVANRISYFCDFKGPSFVLDTACSTSLYAIHLAVDSILHGECQVALAGGVNLTLHPSKYEMLHKLGFLASDGRCHSFGEGGDGYVPGEGVGVILLKPLHLAIKDRDNILGVIKGSGVSQDGKTSNYFVPNPVAQTQAIDIALEQSKIDPRTINYVEAHGTGTPLGDPIEITGLQDAYEKRTSDKQFCAIGSVKSNLGHLEGAAGISQMTKVLLQLHAKMIAPNLIHAKNLNPNIKFEKTPFYVQQTLTPWKKVADQPRRAGVSSFGAGGVNVHVILEEYETVKKENQTTLHQEVVIPLSANKIESLKEGITNLQAFLKARISNKDALFGNIDLQDLAYTLQVGRVPMRYRLALIVKSLPDLVQQLENLSIDSQVHDKQAQAQEKVDVDSLIKTNDLKALSRAWSLGQNIPWEKLHVNCQHHHIYLPTYAFAKEKCWVGDGFGTQEKKEAKPELLKVEAKPEAIKIVPAAGTVPKKQKYSPILRSLIDVPESEQFSIILGYLRKLIAEKLEYTPPKLPDIHQGFFDLGITSIQAIEMHKEIEQTLMIKLSETAVFDHPTLKDFTGYALSLIDQSIDISDDEMPVAVEETVVAAEKPVAVTEETIKKPIEEGVAVIGMSCRFPGGCNTPEQFWEFIVNGKDAIGEIPSDRWDIHRYFDKDPEAIGKTYTRYGGFLSQKVSEFDARLFNVSAIEAIDIDPQQRLLLELTWEAFENANYDPSQMTGSKTGVYIGIGIPEYTLLPDDKKNDDPSKISPYWLTGIINSLASGRISHTFGLQGPAVSVDTACSSALVAAHLACKSIIEGECEMALAGGMNLLLSPLVYVGLCRVRALAPDGHCKPLDEKADGYGRGEGGGIVVLKRLSLALKDGDNILAIIKGSAINQDGPSSGLTVPNGNAQQILLQEALNHANLKPEEISYLEAHGTGTSLGDPIEMRSVTEVLGKNRTAENPLFLGAVKGNIGHLEAAAGIAGIIKAVLCIQHQKITPLHINKINPRINLEKIPAKIPDHAMDWQPQNKRRYVGISSFGFSGTNAHMILTDPPIKNEYVNTIDRSTHILALSAKTEPAFKELVSKYVDYLKHSEAKLADIAYSANVGHAHFSNRIAFVAASKDELQNSLANYKDKPGEKMIEEPKLLFIFTSFQSEHKGYGSNFYKNFPLYKRTIEELDPVIISLIGVSASEMLYGKASIEGTSHKRACEFAIEYALYSLYKSWGIKCDGVYGESTGTYVAAVVAGIMDCKTALTLLLQKPENINFVELTLSAPKITFISSRTGTTVKSSELTNPQYWKQPSEETTNQNKAIETIKERGYNIYVQINPGKALIDSEHSYITTSGPDECQTMIQTLAHLYNNGITVNWRGFDQDYHRKIVRLPNYPFQRKPYWIELGRTGVVQIEGSVPLKGSEARLPMEERNFTFKISRKNLPELNDTFGILHVGFFQDMLLNALSTMGEVKIYTVHDLTFLLALTIEENELCTVVLTLSKSGDKYKFQFQRYHEQTGQWSVTVKGEVNIASQPPMIDLHQIPDQLKVDSKLRYNHESFYSMMDAHGMVLGKSVQLVDQVWIEGNQLFASLNTNSEKHELDFPSAILDACAQLFHAMLPEGSPQDLKLMVSRWGTFTLTHQPYQKLFCYIEMNLDSQSKSSYTGDFILMNERGEIIAYCQECKMHAVTDASLASLKAAMSQKLEKTTDNPLLGKLSSLSPEERQSMISDVVKDILSRLLSTPKEELEVKESIANYGMDSIMGITLRTEIMHAFGVQMPIEEIIAGPTISTLANTITQLIKLTPVVQSVTEQSPWFPVKQNPQAKFRLFCFHDGGRAASIYKDWQSLLPATIEVCPIQLPGRENRIKEAAYTDIEKLIGDLSSVIETRLDLPYAIYGHSMGALISYRFVLDSMEKNRPLPQHLFVGAFTSPQLTNPRLSKLKAALETVHLAHLFSQNQWTDEELIALINSKVFEDFLPGKGTTVNPEMLVPYARIWMSDLKIVDSYKHHHVVLGNDITAFFGSEDSDVPEKDMKSWTALTYKKFALHKMNGGHLFIDDLTVRSQIVKIINGI